MACASWPLSFSISLRLSSRAASCERCYAPVVGVTIATQPVVSIDLIAVVSRFVFFQCQPLTDYPASRDQPFLIFCMGRRHARGRYASIADVLLHSSATTLCANKRRMRSADDLSASTGSRRLRGTRFAGTPDLRWRSPINLSEHRIESPQATEACAHGDLRHREIGLVQKPLRPLHACRLGDLNRACTEVHLEEPGQMSRTDPETIGQSLDTAVIKCTVRDEPERTFDSRACSLPCRRERSSLGPAPQTRSETRKFGRRCRRIEHYVGRLGRAHRTDRAAVDTCRANARKE